VERASKGLAASEAGTLLMLRPCLDLIGLNLLFDSGHAFFSLVSTPKNVVGFYTSWYDLRLPGPRTWAPGIGAPSLLLSSCSY
jgi:hypothetical protein